MSDWTGKRVAVILAPGGLPGIECHVGAWLACEEAGLVPAHLSGCSAGAIVGAMWAYGQMTAVQAANYVAGLQTTDLVKKRLFWKARALRLEHFCDPSPIAARLQALLPYTFDSLRTPLRISATRMAAASAMAAHFDHGPILREAVQASAAIAGVWPYVRVNGLDYSDGGTTDSIVLPPKMHEYDHILVVNTIRLTDFRHRDKNIISRLMWSLEAVCEKEASAARSFMNKSFHDKLTWCDVNVGSCSSLQFSAGHALIASARRTVATWIASAEHATKPTPTLVEPPPVSAERTAP